MAEFDDKLNSILSNPDAMAQIMQLAQSLGGDSQPADSRQAAAPQPRPSPSGGDALSALAGGLDPKLLTRLLPLVQELGGGRDSNARQLLYALRPFLKESRRDKVDQALRAARILSLGKRFLGRLGE